MVNPHDGSWNWQKNSFHHVWWLNPSKSTLVGGFNMFQPIWKIWVRQLGVLFPILPTEWKNKPNVPNHQPVHIELGTSRWHHDIRCIHYRRYRRCHEPWQPRVIMPTTLDDWMTQKFTREWLDLSLKNMCDLPLFRGRWKLQGIKTKKHIHMGSKTLL